MKKFLLSFTVILFFIGYSFQQRRENLTTHSNLPVDTKSNSQNTSNNNKTSLYKNGQYTGSIEDAFYGNIQIQVTIANGKITDVQFLQYPNDRENSIAINTQAIPILKQETIQAQKAQVDIVTGATQSSEAFVKSLQSALNKAKNA